MAVAASLVFVAGVSSLMLRSNGGESTQASSQLTAESIPSTPVLEPAPAPAPTSTAPAAAREAPARDVKIAVSPPPPPPSATSVRARTADVRFDSVAALKVAPASAPVVGAVANEARRSDTGSVGRVGADSIVPLRQEVATSERQLRQQGAPRQAVQQLRFDSLQQATAQSAALSSGLRRSVVTTGAGAAMADAAGPGGACYRLRGLTAPAVADTIRLLNVMAPALSDPSWFRTQLYGALRDTTLAWRSVDSVTVELRAHFGSDTTAVRFRTDGAALDAAASPRVRLTSAERVGCPR